MNREGKQALRWLHTKQVNHSHAHNYKKLLPKASLRIIENGGHMAYWACNEDQQKQALQQLLQS